jgi:hypothetical protein
LNEAQTVLAQADPQTMAPLTEEYRYQGVPSTYGGVEQRWGLIHAQEGKGCKKLCRTAWAWATEAPQALASCAQALPATFLATSPVRLRPRYDKRGRPGEGAQPNQVVYHIAGALVSSLAARPARIAQQSCFMLATNALADTHLPPQELLAGYKGQGQAERGFRFLKAPQFLASSLYLNKPERLMAL